MHFRLSAGIRHTVVLALGLAALAGCAAPPAGSDEDVYEGVNRKVHAVNVGVDRYVLRPISNGPPGAILRSPIGTGIDNVANNLGAPSDALNAFLQGNPENGLHNSWRFLLNSTIGLAGIFDPATAIGIERRKSDFGATLHTWGAGEGAFVMLPFVGPSTTRDTVGMVVDAVIDPVGMALDAPESHWVRGINLTSKLGDRARLGKTVDSILYESADSYSQLRLMYLQNRRFELGQEADDAFIDPYDDTEGN